MGKTVLKGIKLYVDGYDVSGDHNAIAFNYGADLKDSTTIGDLTHKREGGLKTLSASHAGLWEGGTDNIGDVLFSRVGNTGVVTTICPTTGLEGDPCFFSTMAEASYAPGASVGELFAFQVQFASVSDFFSGNILHNATRTSSGTGTIMNLGAVTALQRVTAALHVYETVSGTSPTLDVLVQSAAAVGFSSPTTRFTFSQKTAIGAQQLASVVGPITDAYWRVSYTIGGSATPTFPFIVSLSIQ